MKSYSDQKKIEFINIALLGIFFLTTVLQLAVMYIPALQGILSNYYVNIFVSQGVVILPVIVFFVYCGINVREELKIRKMKVSNVLLVILFGFLIQPVLRFLNALSLCFTNNETSEMMLDLSETVPFVPALILVCLLPALVEETVFRGAAYRTYRKADPIKAILLSAFLFGLLHGNLNQFLYAFAMGIIFCLLNEATGSIVSSSIVHFITNAISLIAIYSLPAMYEYLKFAVGLYEEMGMTEMAEYIEYNFGDMTLSSQEWMRQMLEESEQIELSVGGVLFQYLPSALIFGLLAWLLLKVIAKRCGNWDKFRKTFLGEDNVPVEKEARGPYDAECTTDISETEGDHNLKILSIPLMLTIAIGVLMMFVYETLKMLPKFK